VPRKATRGRHFPKTKVSSAFVVCEHRRAGVDLAARCTILRLALCNFV
jgi:hypothetical protein